MTIYTALHGLAEIAEEVPSIRDLHGLRCALPDGISIGAGTVTGDNLDPVVTPQLGRERVGLAVGQKVDDLVAFQVDQDRPVVLAAPPRPVIDSQHAGRRRQGHHRAMNQTQQGIGACRHGQPPGKPGAGLAAKSETQLALDAPQPRGAACRAGRDGSQRLGKGLTRTAGIAATEAAYPDQEHGRTPLPRQVRQSALVVGVDTGGVLVAAGTDRSRSPKAGDDGDLVGRRHDPLDREAGRDQRQNAF